MNFISGGYMSGTSTLEVYDADILSAVSGLIVTSMQYRYRTEDSHTCLHM
jgi:carboxylesterase type B